MSKKNFTKPTKNFEILTGPVTIEGAVWKGVSACLLNDKTGEVVVLTAPDAKQLKSFWSELTDDKLDMSQTKTTVGNYDFIKKEEEKEGDKLFWILDKEEPRCFISVKCNSKRYQTLGEVVRNTETECKILLRKLGWDKEDIAEVMICMVDDDIPF